MTDRPVAGLRSDILPHPGRVSAEVDHLYSPTRQGSWLFRPGGYMSCAVLYNDRRNSGATIVARLASIGGSAPLFAFESFGARIGVDAPGVWSRDTLTSHLPPRSTRVRPDRLDVVYRVGTERPQTASGETEGSWRISRGEEPLSRPSSRAEALRILAHDLNFAVALHARGWVFLHAGVVLHRGELLLFPGASGWGKTTLVRELVSEGARYYSDDYAPVDSQGRIHAYPRDLRVRGENGFHEFPDPHAHEERPSKPASAVYFLRHTSGDRQRTRPLSSGKALMLLLENCAHARESPGRSISRLRRIVRDAGAWAGERGDARETARQLLADDRGPEELRRSDGIVGTKERQPRALSLATPARAPSPESHWRPRLGSHDEKSHDE